MSEIQKTNPFEGGVAVGEASSAGVVAAHAREEYELKAMFTVAHSVGRNEAEAYNRAMVSCERPGFAEGCTYSFPRGGTKVTGPSVQMARELARCWGSIIYELRIIDVGEDEVHIRAVAIDLIAVNRVSMEDKFRKKIQRKSGNTTRWIEPDERDLRELINRRGAICVRNALLQLLPPDVVEDAVAKAAQTLEAAAAGDLEGEQKDRTLKAILATFRDIHVTQQMIEGYIGTPYQRITPTQVADLRSVFSSIRDGNTQVADHFEVVESRQTSEATQDFNAQLRKKAGAGDPGPTESPEATKSPKTPQEPPQEVGGRSSTTEADKTQEGANTTATSDSQGFGADEKTAQQAEAAKNEAGAMPDSEILEAIYALEKARRMGPKRSQGPRSGHAGTTEIEEATRDGLIAYYVWLSTVDDQTSLL